jgi:hypothetical protein
MWTGQTLAFGCSRILKNTIRKCPRASYRCLLAVGTVLSLAASLAIGCRAQVNVSTYHNNKQRTGGNTLETSLTPSNVNSTQFGKLYSQAVDGFIYAQPLYMPNVNVAGLGIHNVVYVATMNDSVYAFDADSKTGGNAYPLWHVSFINAANGITPIPYGDIQCTDPISTKIGIMGTPVIDTVGGTLYVLVRTKEWGQYFQRLHALDITSGAENSAVRSSFRQGHWVVERGHSTAPSLSIPRFRIKGPHYFCKMGWFTSDGARIAIWVSTTAG